MMQENEHDEAAAPPPVDAVNVAKRSIKSKYICIMQYIRVAVLF